MRRNKLLILMAATLLATSSVASLPVEASTVGQALNASDVKYGRVNNYARNILRDMFDAEYYAAQNPDVVKAFGNNRTALFNHFLRYGVFEGRSCNKDFNVSAYKSCYQDLSKAFGDNILSYYVHYADYGKKENRTLTTVEAAVEAGYTVVSAAVSNPAAAVQVPRSLYNEPTSSNDGSDEYVDVLEKSSPYTILRDSNGNIFDLGGIEVVIRDWFSPSTRPAAKTEYDEAKYAYQDWVQETYNFKVKTTTIGNWGSSAQDFINYATTGGDNNNYVFTIPAGFSSSVANACRNGLVYDLSSLECLDFSKEEFSNNAHKLFTIKGHTYAMRAGFAEPRTGLFFNKKILSDAGVDPDSIYDMQANGTWTWSAFEDVLSKVQQDINNDGTIDIWGLGLNEGVMVAQAVYSNGGQFVGVDANGNYTYELESPQTIEALNWVKNIFDTYDWNGPDDAMGNSPAWDYYQSQFKNGGCAFCCDQQYCATPGNLFYETEDDLGFVMFPKGPRGNMVNDASDNICVIPSCYSADRAWKIAFAYSVYNDIIPGYENYNPHSESCALGNFDTRACYETVPMMSKNSTVLYQAVIPGFDMGGPLTFKFYPGMGTVDEVIEGCRDLYKQKIAEANN